MWSHLSPAVHPPALQPSIQHIWLAEENSKYRSTCWAGRIEIIVIFEWHTWLGLCIFHFIAKESRVLKRRGNTEFQESEKNYKQMLK